jgi:hypothetical protein
MQPFRPGALLQLALGHRTLPQVLDTWPDCLVRDRSTEQFLTAAFPPGTRPHLAP